MAFAISAGNDTALQPSLVITGLVPVIPLVWSAAPVRIGMAGTRLAMTGEGMLCSSFVLDSSLKLGYIVM